MRDKYIELIINYIKDKPGYEDTLDNIKKEVLALGASEQEFDVALNRITGSVQNPISHETVPTDFITQNTIQPEFKTGNKQKVIEDAKKLAGVAKKIGGSRKKYVAVISFLIILVLSISQFINLTGSTQTSTVSKDSPKQATNKQKGIIPVVYASGLQVDADKIFSIKSPTAQLTVSGKPKKEVLGFFPYWMISKYDQISLNTLTSVSLFGLDADGSGNISTQDDSGANGGWAMWKDENLDKFIARAKSYGLTVTLTIKSFYSNNIDSLVASDTAQQKLISNILYLVNSKNLDGVNIDFEYVGNPPDTTRDGFTRFIINLNAELKRQDPSSILTIDTYLVSGSDKGIFDIPVLALNSDAFVIMGYDMHTPGGSAGPIAAMGGETNVIGYVQNYLEKVDPKKLILAVPYYGYDWPKDLSGGREAVKILPYAQIAETSKDAQLIWDETSQTPSFTYKGEGGEQRVVYFDNVRSLAVKYDFINKKDLRGVGIWALGYDGQNQDLEKLLIDKFINQ